jgi:hypothetical protein
MPDLPPHLLERLNRQGPHNVKEPQQLPQMFRARAGRLRARGRAEAASYVDDCADELEVSLWVMAHLQS